MKKLKRIDFNTKLGTEYEIVFVFEGSRYHAINFESSCTPMRLAADLRSLADTIDNDKHLYSLYTKDFLKESVEGMPSITANGSNVAENEFAMKMSPNGPILTEPGEITPAMLRQQFANGEIITTGGATELLQHVVFTKVRSFDGIQTTTKTTPGGGVVEQIYSASFVAGVVVHGGTVHGAKDAIQ